MKTFFVSAFLALCVLLGACSISVPKPTASEPIVPQANFWQQLGNEVGSGYYTSMSQTVDGYPVVAYTDNIGISSRIYVKKWSGLGWLQLGDSLSRGSTSSTALLGVSSLAVDASNNPVVAYTDCIFSATPPPDCIGDSIFVKRWNGSSWLLLGGILDISNNKTARDPSLALNSTGNPVVTWSEIVGESSQNIYVKRWNGTSWVQLGATVNSFSDRKSSNPNVALDRSGNPVVGWYECVAVSLGNCINYNVYVKRWNGSSWVQLGTSLDVNPNEGAFQPTLVVDSSGNPIVTWNEFDITAATKIYVKRWNGSSWVQLGTSLNVSAPEASSSHIALDGAGNPLVSWSEHINSNSTNIYVKRWKDNKWSLFGPNPINKAPITVGFEPSISIVNGNYAIAWTGRDGYDGQQNVYVHHYAINAWQPLGDALDTNPLNDAKFSSIARKSDNRPIVAWTEQITTSDSNVYVKERVGNSWRSLGTVDKVAGNFTTSASIAMRNDNRPVVTFTESSNSNSIIDVFVRRWNGTSWLNVGGALSNNHLDINPKLVLNNTNTPFVAWISCPLSGCGLYVKKFNGSAWVGLDGSAAPLPLATALSASATVEIVLDSLGNPVVGWTEGSVTGYTLRFRRWSGTSWQALRSIPLGFSSPRLSLAIDSTNKPFVAANRDNLLNVFYLDGTWKRLGTTNLDSNNPENLVLQMGSDDRPVILWRYTTSGPFFFSGINVQRWNGSTWVTVGASAITGFLEDPFRLDMVLKSNNNPIVSFDMQVQSTNKQDVYVKQY